MNAQHLLGTTTQGIVNNYFLNGNEDIVKGTFEKYRIYLSLLVNVRVSYSFIVFLQQL